MRVYEIAREVGIPNKDLLAKIRALGLEVNNHMSSIDPDDVVRIKRSLEKERQAATETQRLSSTVLRRRSNKDDGPVTPPPAPTPPVAPPTVRRRAVAVEDAGEREPQRTAPHRPAAPSAPERTERPAPIERPAAVEPASAAPAEPVLAEPVRTEPEVPAIRRRAAGDATVAEPVVATGSAPTQTGGRAEPSESTASMTSSAEPSSAPASEPPTHAVEEPRNVQPISIDRQKGPAAPPAGTSPERPRQADAPARAEAGQSSQASQASRAPASGGSGASQGSGAPARTPAAASAGPGRSDARDESRPRSRAIIAGPAVVSRPGAPQPIVETMRSSSGAHASHGGHGGHQPQASGHSHAASQARPSPTVIVRTREDRSAPGPTTVAEVAETARSRFEAELERARARVAEREAEERSKSPSTGAPAAAASSPSSDRDPGRPAVGSIISLPMPRIKITERAPVPGRALPASTSGPAGQIRGRFAQQQQQRGKPPGGGGRGDFGKRKLPLNKKGKSTQLTTPAEHKRVIRIEDTITISDLARQMGIKATEVLKKLWGMGMTGVNINASIDLETAQLLSNEFGYEVQNVAFKEASIFSEEPDDDTKMVLRSPVVTIMGHVDHGKTSMLDAIRKTRVAAGEAGGITQHIAAYKVPSGTGRDIVFLDTPGHEAFTEMRARGAQATDIVILVVAANDGVMPQTLEALSHAKDAKVPIIVAVNKVDLPDAAPERVRQQLADHGLIPEEWGGDTQYVNVSALRGEGIDKLLETIGLIAELGELRANPEKPAMGVVIEARLDRNRGPMATVLIQEGTLRVGDVVVAGRCYGKVRAMLDDLGRTLKEAGPSTPIELLGLDGVPEAGDTVNVAEDDRVAKQVVEHRRQGWRKRELATTSKVSLESIMERIHEGENKELKLVLKADVQGSAEALKAALVKQSTEKVKVNVISAGVGGITESDVNLAKAGGAIIIGFHVRPAGKSAKHAEQEGVQIKLYDIIYEALDEVKAAMAGLLAPIKRELPMGKLEVRETFTIPKIGTIAGTMVTDGKITRKALLRVIRDAIQIYEGRVGSLRRFKEDVSEVQHGFECGVMIAGFNDLKTGDIIETYEVVEEAAKL